MTVRRSVDDRANDQTAAQNGGSVRDDRFSGR
jgi:hypothetical protein